MKKVRAWARGTEPGKAREPAVKLSFDPVFQRWNRSNVIVGLGQAPICKGTWKQVFKMHEFDDQGRLVEECVAKFLDQEALTRQGFGPITRKMYFDDAKTQIVAQQYAELFGNRVRFLEVWILELVGRPGSPICLAEAFLKGDFCKHNNNSGDTLSSQFTPQAFSHFTYEASGHRLLVCDIQGVCREYTDPQVHTRNGTGFGIGNNGTNGFRHFFESHTCNPLCELVGLPHVRAGVLQNTPPEPFRLGVPITYRDQLFNEQRPEAQRWSPHIYPDDQSGFAPPSTNVYEKDSLGLQTHGAAFERHPQGPWQALDSRYPQQYGHESHWQPDPWVGQDQSIHDFQVPKDSTWVTL
eukprot:CAMPEP_0114554138 /NCGR_PEP_ID=MMETSP0114-20121206/8047_1 /TAXON_ID=31324 /ORGANISM="Goniomonas sp, Strain m" /LENGTH=352 /DNA_ID=CAMNT_0001739159 /DNA_START=6 /DNA_END=1064 /DNA_ORIENTATION=+